MKLFFANKIYSKKQSNQKAFLKSKADAFPVNELMMTMIGITYIQ